MFNNYYLNDYVPYEKSVKITENKAPTDESIKLYKEFREEAEKDVLRSITINDNSFSISVIIVPCMESWKKKIKYRYLINSKEILGEV